MCNLTENSLARHIADMLYCLHINIDMCSFRTVQSYLKRVIMTHLIFKVDSPVNFN